MKDLIERFLSWPVPASVYPDGTPGQPGRTGTNLLSYDEARQMLEHVLTSPEVSTQAVVTDALTEAAEIIKAYMEDAGYHVWGDEEGNDLLGYRPPQKSTRFYEDFMKAADWLCAHGFADWDASGRTEYVFMHKTPRTPSTALPVPGDAAKGGAA